MLPQPKNILFLLSLFLATGCFQDPVGFFNATPDPNKLAIPPDFTLTSPFANAVVTKGQEIPIMMSFNQPVFVEDGNPSFSLSLKDGKTAKATYQSGSGTNELVFIYNVSDGDFTELLEVIPGSYQSNGARILGPNNEAIFPVLPQTNTARALSKNAAIKVDAINAVVSSITSSAPDKTYGASEVISVLVIFLRPVVVDTSGGTPELSLELSNGITTAIYAGGSGTEQLRFDYTVANGDEAQDLGVLSSNSLNLNGGTIEALDSSLRAFTGLPPPTSNYSLRANKNINVDAMAPTIVRVSSDFVDGQYGQGSMIPIDIIFSEPITVLTPGAAQLTLETGTSDATANFIGVSSNRLTLQYTVGSGESSSDLNYQSINALNPNGIVVADSVGNVVSDWRLPALGALQSLAGQKNIQIDAVAPTVTLATTEVSPTSSTSIDIAVSSSEPIMGITSSDFTLTNAIAESFSSIDSQNYTLRINPISPGALSVTLPAAAAMDLYGNPSTASNTINLNYDSSTPSVTLTSSSSNDVNSGPISVTATFSEAVTGFVLGDLLTSNAVASNLATSDNILFTFDLNPSAEGAFTAQLPAASTQDLSGLNSLASNTLTRNYDTTSPTASFSTATSDPTNSATFSATLTFSEDVSGLTLGEISATNATLSNLNSSNAAVYTFDVAPSADGAVTFSLAASVAQDSAGNNNSPATSLNLDYDSSDPSVVLSTAESEPTSSSSFSATATYSEEVTGFNLGDISLTNGTASNLATSDNIVFTFDVAPSSDGVVAIDIAGAAAQDLAGNSNTAATTLNRTYDSSAPTVGLSSASSAQVNAAFSVTATFSEEVSGFASGDVSVANGSVSAFTTSDNIVWSFDVTPTAEGLVSVNIPSAIAQDLSGNDNTAAAALNRTFDNTAPTLSLTTPASEPTSDSPLSVTATFNEEVSGFSIGDITVTNGTPSNFSTSDNIVYTFDVTPTVSGGVDIDVAGSVAQDLAGNNNSAATTLSRTYDGTLPSVALSSASSALVNAAFSVTATFSEEMVGFATGDVTITNGTLSSFTTSDNIVWTFDVTPTAEGAVDVDIAAGVAQDLSANDNSAATTLSRTFDNTAPTVALTTAESEPTSNSPFSVTATFSEEVTGFAIGDLSVGNGAASNLATSDNTVFTFDITPSANGVVSIDLAGSVAQDLAGNNNSAAPTLIRTYDGTAPTVSLASASSGRVNTAFSVTATFSEEMTGFVSGDVSVTNGTVSAFSTSDNIVWTFDVTPAAEGAVDVDIAPGVAQDLSANDNAAAATLSRTYDVTAPTVALTSASSEPNSSSPFSVTATFSEEISGFAIGDIAVTNGTPTNLATSDNIVFTFDITPSTDGTVNIDVAGSTAQDLAGNNNSAAPTLTRTFDSTAPTLSLTTAASEPTGTSPFSVTATFSEEVSGFAIGDITVTNGTASSLSTSDNTVFTFDVTPSADGVVNVDVAGSIAQDLAGNDNSAAATLTRTYDGTAPTVVLSSAVAARINAAFSVTATFSEEMTGFISGDVTVTNGSISNFTSSDNIVWTFDVTPTSEGGVDVDIPASVAQDLSANDNSAATTLSRVFDTTAPGLTLTSSATEPTSNSPIPVTATFSEEVSGFSIGDVTVANGTPSNFATSDNVVFTFDVTPSSNGIVDIDVAGAISQDLAGNNNTAATTLSRTYDGTAPTVSLSSASSAQVNSAFSVTATFSEEMTGFVSGDVSVTNGTVSAFTTSDNIVWTFDVAPATDGPVNIDIAAGVAQDLSANDNAAAPTLSRIYDTTAPTIALITAASEPTSTTPFSVTATFSEEVSGFAIGDITVSNGTPLNLATSDNTVFTFDVTPSANGAVDIDVAGAVAQDLAGNNNTVAITLTRTYDGTAPSVAITSASSAQVNAAFSVTATFSEEMTGFSSGDISVTNGTVSAFTTSDNIVWTFDVTPTTEGVVDVDIAAGVAQDLSSNNNTAAATLSRTFDNTAPTLALTSAASEPTSSSSFSVTVTFSEEVSGFAIGDILVSSGTASNLASSDNIVFTFDVTPSAEGAVDIDVAGAVAQDLAGNNNTAATTLRRTYDGTAPTVTLTSASSTQVNATFSVTATFSEEMTGFTSGDVSVTNGTVSAFTTSDNIVWTFDVTPTAEGVVDIDIASAVAQDVSGNDNTAAITLSRTFDSTAPTVTFSSAVSEPTSDSPFSVTATFSEEVSGFAIGDIVVTNGTASNLATIDNIAFTFDVTPSANGAVDIDTASSVAQDLAGNNNTAATTFTRTFDGTAPTVALSSASSSHVNAAFSVTATFSEEMTGFASGDVSVTNGTISAFTTSDNIAWTFDVTPTAEGSVDVDIAAAVAQDLSGNDNTMASTLSRMFDTTAPTVALSSAASEPTSSSPISVTATFSEEVSGFVIGDVGVTNGTASNLATSDNIVFTFDVTPTSDGGVDIDIASSVAQDLASNDNTAATTLSRTFDSTAPTITLSSASSSRVNSSFSVTATFSEQMSGFTVGDLNITNGSASNFSTSDDTIWTFDVTPMADGAVDINVSSAVAQDLAGIDNTAATTLTRIFDSSAPTVSITTAESDPTNSSTFSVTATFSEEVSGIVTGDFNSTNATLSNLASSDNIVFTLDVTPSSPGTVSVNLPASSGQDLAGNNTQASNTLSVDYDNSAPTIIIGSTASDPTNQSSIPVTITFSEEVSGFTSGDLILTNATQSNFSTSDNTVFTVDLSPVGQGTVELGVNASVAQDLAGNNNTAAMALQRTFDSVAPTLAFSSAESDPTNSASWSVTATFSELVSGFQLTDLTRTNATLSNLATSDNIVYTFDVTPLTDGEVRLGAGTGIVQDSALNDNTAATDYTTTYDSTPPSIFLSSTEPSPTSSASFSVTVTFGEEVTGLTTPDFTTENATLSNLSTSDDIVYTIDITPSSTGLFSLRLPVSTVTDLAGNANDASNALSWTKTATETLAYLREDCTAVPNPTPCYESLSAWQTASGGLTDKDLVTQTSKHTLLIQGEWSAPDSTGVVISGWTTNEDYHLTIRTEGAARHNGLAKGNRYRLDPSADGHAIVLGANGAPADTQYTILDGLEITGVTGTSNEGIRWYADHSLAENLFIHDLVDNQDADAIQVRLDDGIVTIRNSLFYNIQRSAIGTQFNATINTIFNIENVTSYHAAAHRLDGSGYRFPSIGPMWTDDGTEVVNDGQVWNVKNTIVKTKQSSENSEPTRLAFRVFDGATWGSVFNNASDDATAPGTNALHNVNFADSLPSSDPGGNNIYFQDMGSTVKDFRLLQSPFNDAIGTGANLAGSGHDKDISGIPRGASWDRGAFELGAEYRANSLAWQQESPTTAPTLTAEWVKASSPLLSQSIQIFQTADCSGSTVVDTSLSTIAQDYEFVPAIDGTYSFQISSTTAKASTVSGCSPRIVKGDLPGVILSSTLPGPTDALSIPLTITFDRPVTGLTESDFTIANGHVGVLTEVVDGRIFEMYLTPKENGLISVSLPAAAASDAATSLTSAASNIFSIGYTGESVAASFLRENCTIPSEPSPCYTSLDDWDTGEAGITWTPCSYGDLICLNKKAVLKIQGSWSSADTSSLFLSDWDTLENRNLTIMTEGVARHNGTPTTNSYRLTPPSGSHAMVIGDGNPTDALQYTVIDGLRFDGLDGNDRWGIRTNNGLIATFKNLLVHDATNGAGGIGIYNSDSNITIANSIFYKLSSAAVESLNGTNQTITINNVSAYNVCYDPGAFSNCPGIGFLSGSSFPSTGSVFVVTNSFVHVGNINSSTRVEAFRLNVDDSTGAFTGSDYNMSSDGTAPGASSLTNVNFSDSPPGSDPGGDNLYLENLALGSEDLRLQNVGFNDGLSFGTDLSSSGVSTDILGMQRDATPDIGAYEFRSDLSATALGWTETSPHGDFIITADWTTASGSVSAQTLRFYQSSTCEGAAVKQVAVGTTDSTYTFQASGNNTYSYDIVTSHPAGASYSSCSSAMSISVSAGTKVKLAFSTQPSATATAGVDLATQPVVEIRDVADALVSAADTITLAAYLDSDCQTASTGTFNATPTAASSGSATFSGVDHERAESIFIKASSPGLSSACSSAVTVSPSSKSQLTIGRQPASVGIAEADLSQQPQIHVTDNLGNIITGASDSVTMQAFTDSGCSVSAGGTLSASVNPLSSENGVAQFNGVSYDQVENIYLGFSAAGLSSACSNLVELRNTPPATHISFDRLPSNPVIAGQAFSPAPVISFVDDDGVVDQTQTSSVTLDSAVYRDPNCSDFLSGVSLTADSLSVSAINGKASFSNVQASRQASGVYLRAHSTGFPDTCSTKVDIISASGANARTVGSGIGTSATTTQSLDLAAEENLLIVALTVPATPAVTISSITFDSSAMTLLNSISGSNHDTYIYYQASPSTTPAELSVGLSGATNLLYSAFAAQNATIVTAPADLTSSSTDPVGSSFTMTSTKNTSGMNFFGVLRSSSEAVSMNQSPIETLSTAPLAGSNNDCQDIGFCHFIQHAPADVASVDLSFTAASGDFPALESLGLYLQSSQKLRFATAPSQFADQSTAFPQSPAVEVLNLDGTRNTGFSSTITLSAYQDERCLTPVSSGSLSNSSVAAASGLASFSGVSFNEIQRIFLKASAAGVDSACSSAVNIDDGNAPTLAWSSNASNPTYSSPFRVTATFSEPVLGFYLDDIEASNATLRNFEELSTTAYRFEVSPISAGLVRLNVAAGSAIDMSGNPMLASSEFSRTFELITCPFNYMPITPNFELNTDAFCVMQWEAKAWNDADSNDVVDAGELDADGCNEPACSTGNWGTATHSPASSPKGGPWRNISANTAFSECDELNSESLRADIDNDLNGDGTYALISNAEWMAVARDIESNGTNWTSGTVGTGCLKKGNIGGTFACSSVDSGYNHGGVDTRDDRTGGETAQLNLSSGVIWDFSGNVSEWTSWDSSNTFTSVTPANKAYNSADGAPTSSALEFNEIDSNIGASDEMALLTWRPSDPNYTATDGVGRYFAGSDSSGGAAHRGGAYDYSLSAGIYYLNLAPPATNFSDKVGFRCVFRP